MTVKVHHLSARATDVQRMNAFMGFDAKAQGQHCAIMWVMGLYDHVADVEGDSKNLAYQLTNNIDTLWCNNNGVVAMGTAERGPDEHRSTSMGDIMVTEDGAVHVVAAMGFTDVTPYFKMPAIV